MINIRATWFIYVNAFLYDIPLWIYDSELHGQFHRENEREWERERERDILGDPEITQNINCKSRNLSNTDAQNYSKDLR